MRIEKIEALVQQFQDKTLPKEAWTHEAHLIVALWHIKHYSKAEATCLLRAGIINYNIAVGTENNPTGGYHETITLFWIGIINDFLKSHKKLNISELVDEFLTSSFVKRNVLLKYYSKELLFSVKARANWVEPDLQELSFEIV